MTDEGPDQPKPAVPGPAPPELAPAPPTDRPPANTGWAMGAHLSALSTFIGVPLGNVLGPLIIWLIKRAEDPFVAGHAKEALNFNISVTIYGLILVAGGVALLVSPVGILLFVAAAVLGMAWLVLTIVAAVRASGGEVYRYPLTMRLVK